MRRRLLLAISVVVMCAALGFAQKKTEAPSKHASGLENIPAKTRTRLNPYEGNPQAVQAGRKLYGRYCVECHSADARGRDKAPALDSETVQQAAPGDLFWFLTNGNLRTGMPSWSRLPEAQRWQIVAFLKTSREPPTPLR